MRSQFTFYESFYKALARIRKGADRATAYDIIVRYALYGEEPDLDSLPDTVAIAFELVLPMLEASKRKSDAGKKGGESKRKQTASKPEAKAKQTEANGKQNEAKPKQEQVQVQVQVEVQEQGKEQGKEQMLYIPPCPPSGGQPPLPPQGKQNGSKAVAAFLDKINPMPSSLSMQELMDYERELGSDVCLRAIDEAMDANARNWKYVRAVLNRCKGMNVTSLDAWDRQEALRKEKKAKGTAMCETVDSGLGYAVPVGMGDNDAIFAEVEAWSNG